MHVKVFATYLDVPERILRDRIVVVIDLLRASTTIVQALESGAQSVIPLETVDAAAQIKRNRGADTLLVCERDGMMVEGCDLGNSPTEFIPTRVRRKVIAMSTSNGSRAIQRVKENKVVLIGSLRNRKRLCEFLLEQKFDVALVCAGSNQQFSADDLYCAGGILAGLREIGDGKPLDTDDLGFVAENFYYTAKANPTLLEGVAHYRKLQDLGLQKDIDFCFAEDRSQIVPVLVDGIALYDVTRMPK